MKTTKALFGILTITTAPAMNGRSQIQIYQFTAPITGSMTMSVQEVSSNAPSGSSGVVNLTLTALSETIYLDPVGATLRQVGALYYSLPDTNIQFQETQVTPPQFPNTNLASVSGTITVYLTPSESVLSFDTGPQPITWNTADSSYTIENTALTPGFAFSGSYSLVTGGQTYTGSFAYSINDNQGNDYAPAHTFNILSISNYPTSLQLSGLGNCCPQGVLFESPGIVANVTASNGFEMQLSPGCEPYWCCSHIGEIFSWTFADTVTATNLAYAEASIIDQPQSEIVQGNTAASFSVTASGALPLSYQWSFDGSNISGATNSSWTISYVTPTNLGTYAVVVTNSFGTNTSSNAVLSMYPYLDVPFSGVVTNWGQNAVLSVVAWGTGLLTYQWFDNGSAVTDATNQELTLTSIQFTNAGLYSVVVSSPLGSVTNTPEQVVVNPAGVSLGMYPGVTVSGVVGYTYNIQSTTDLSNTNSWGTVATLTLVEPVQLWVDTTVNSALPGNPQRFYRVMASQ